MSQVAKQRAFHSKRRTCTPTHQHRRLTGALYECLRLDRALCPPCPQCPRSHQHCKQNRSECWSDRWLERLSRVWSVLVITYKPGEIWRRLPHTQKRHPHTHRTATTSHSHIVNHSHCSWLKRNSVNRPLQARPVLTIRQSFFYLFLYNRLFWFVHLCSDL